MNKLAVQATIHCLIGCSFGEIAGMMLGAHYELDNFTTIVISIVLAFLTGYLFSLIPLVRSGMALQNAMRLVLAADTLSITTMEIADNLTIALIPGALAATLTDWLFWVSITLALAAAFIVAYPVNKFLLERGRGHALIHEHHHSHAAGHAQHEYSGHHHM